MAVAGSGAAIARSTIRVVVFHFMGSIHCCIKRWNQLLQCLLNRVVNSFQEVIEALNNRFRLDSIVVYIMTRMTL